MKAKVTIGPPNVHYDTAIEARSLGLSPLPPKQDGSKAPIAPRYDEVKKAYCWEPLMKVPATDDELQRWYRPAKGKGQGFTGNGLVMGYGNAECLDFDDRETYLRFVETARAVGLGDLVERIAAGYEEESPSEVRHWVYRCEAIEGSTKLAERPAPTEKDPRARKTLIETKGIGGYIITAPSCGKVHPSGKPYRLIRGGLKSIVTIGADERRALLDLARTFDEIPTPQPAKPKAKGKTVAKNPWSVEVTGVGDVRPGDAFEAGVSWADILVPLGWTLVYTRGDVSYWRRPGKDSGGISATAGHCKGLYVFSTSTSFEPRKSYSRFAVYAHLHHADDFKAAAKDLAGQGYGTRLRPKASPSPNGNGHYPTYAPDTLLFCHDQGNVGYVVEDLGDRVSLVFKPGEEGEGHAILPKSVVEPWSGAAPSRNGTGHKGQRALPATDLVTKLASEYKCRPVTFLDGGMLPTKLIVIAGLGGVGKGTSEAGIIADLTRGRPILGLVYEAPGSIEVLMIGSEDGYEDTVVPRLAAAGADLTRVHFLEYATNDKGERLPFSLDDMDALRRFLAKHPAVKAVFIDPISGYVGRTGAKDNNESEIRALLDPLNDLTNEMGVMVVAIKHLNKDEGKTIVSRVGGSVAYVNTPRVCYLVGKHPKDEGLRVMAPFKWNLNAAAPKSVAWSLEKVPAAEADRVIADHGADDLDDAGKDQLREQLNRVRWIGTCEIGAEELIKAATSLSRTGPGNEIERAEKWLKERLAAGPVESMVAAKEGDELLKRPWPDISHGFDAKTVEVKRMGRVKWWRENILKKKLGGMSRQHGFRGGWFFELLSSTQDAWTIPVTGGATEATTEAGPLTPTSVASVASVDSVLDDQDTSKQTTNGVFPTEATESAEATGAGVRPPASEDASVGGSSRTYESIDWRAPLDDKAF